MFRKIKMILAPISLFLIIISCDDNKSNITSPAETTESILEYYPLEIGNTWIYEVFMSDSSLNFVSRNQFDSVSIKKDTIIDGISYKEVYSSFFNETTYITDSAEYIKNSEKEQIFTISEIEELLFRHYYIFNEDTSFVYEWGTQKIDSSCSVPVGDYSAKYIKGIVKPYKYDENKHSYRERKLLSAYAKGIGLILRRQVYIGSGEYLESRLIEYSLKNK